MKSTLSKFFIIVCVLLAAPSMVFCNNLDELDEFIENALVEWLVPGASVSVVEGDKVVFAKGYGVARIKTSEKVDENTIFQLASVSKTFTAAALGVQVDRGLLKWEEEVINYLPEFALKDPYPTRYANTIDLLAHRTGLPAFGGDLLGKIGYSPGEILYRVRLVEPETSFRNRAYYSNLCYFVAGQLLGKLTGSSWEEGVRSTLLSPLKMERSGFAKNLDDKNVAYAHAKIDGVVRTVPWDPTGGFPAAGAVTSTASDMGKWMALFLNKGSFEGNEVLKSETIQSLLSPSMVGEVSFSEAPPIDENSGFSFGLGWDSYHYQNQMIVEKGGGLDGIRTVVTLIPELNVGITVLCNLNLTMLPEAIRTKFLELYVGKSEVDLQAKIKERGKMLLEIVAPPKKPDHPIPSKLSFKDYTGVFTSALYGAFHISGDKDPLTVKVGPNSFEGTLEHWSNHTFLLHWPVINMGYQLVTFTLGPDEHPISIETETLGVLHAEEPQEL